MQEGLKGIHNSIVKVRIAVQYVKLSPKMMDRFKEVVEDEKIQSKSLLSLDVPNITYQLPLLDHKMSLVHWVHHFFNLEAKSFLRASMVCPFFRHKI